MKRLFFLAILPCVLFAQGVDIRGVISDSTTKEKIPFANIYILGTSKGANANVDGFYLIAKVPVGTYEIAASAIGYGRKVVKVTVSGNAPIVLNFLLPSRAVESEEVLISGSRKFDRAEMRVSTHVIEKEDVRQVPMPVQPDIFRSLKMLPGIVSTSDVNSQFHVRGGAGNQNLILFNGIKIYNPFHAFGIFSLFDPDIIRSTEVFTGGFPPGYGNRLSSVISMSTKDGRRDGIGGKASVNFISGKLMVEGPLPKDASFVVNGRQSLFSSTFKRFLDKDVPLSFYDFFIKGSMPLGGEAYFRTHALLTSDELNSPNIEMPSYRWRNKAFGISLSGLFMDRSYFFTEVQLDEYYAESRPNHSQGTPASTKVKDGWVRAEATYYTDTQDQLFAGFETSMMNFENEFTNSYGVKRTLDDNLFQMNAWMRLQKTMKNKQIDFGFHVDIPRLFKSILGSGFSIYDIQPRMNLNYTIASWLRWKATYGFFTQKIVTIANEDDVISLFESWMPIPGDLKIEQSQHVVIGMEASPTPWIVTTLEGYYKDFGSLVSYNREKVDANDPDYINATGNAYGVEALLRYGDRMIDLYLTYSLAFTTIDANGFVYPPRYDRRHNINAMIVLHPIPRLDVSFRWEFGSGLPFTQSFGYYDRFSLPRINEGSILNETGKPYLVLGEKNAARMPAFHRLDISGNYRFSINAIQVNLGGSIINVYDRKNVFYFDRKSGKQINMLSFFPSLMIEMEF
ncbi:MAG: TonB-dependent receptor [bacterium]